MQRVHNWDCLLIEWSLPLIGQPFEWGRTDCASLVRGSQRVIYGEELWLQIPQYTTRAEMLRAFSEFGSVKDQLRALGATKHVLAFAQSGDIVIAPADPDELFDSVAIVLADKLLITDPDRGTSVITLWHAPEQADVYRLP